MAVYDVDLPNGKTIQVQGPDDATDDELIAIARTHPSLAKQSAKPPAETSGAGMKPGQVPELSTPDQLLKDAKASSPGLKASIPGAFEATQGTNALPTAGGLYDLVSQGDMKGAWNALPESVRDVTQYGAPPAIAAYGLKKAYDAYKESSVGEGSQGIKSRTIGADNTPPTPVGGGTPSAAPAEPALSPKEAKIATDIESKYGFNWKDVKNNFNVSNVPITDATQAEILASAFKNQQASATPTTPEAEVIKPAAESAKAPTTPAAETSKTGVAPPEGMREQYSKGKKNPIGPSAFNHLANNLGLEKAKEVWESTYGKKNVPYEQYMSEYSKAAGKDMMGPRQPLPEGAKPGGAFGKPQYIPDYIKGGASLGGMAAAGGTALGALGAYQAYKHGKETGDWTPAGQLALDTVASAINPALLFGTYMSGAGEGEAEALAKERYKAMIGGGRGIAPPSPRQQVGRR